MAGTAGDVSGDGRAETAEAGAWHISTMPTGLRPPPDERDCQDEREAILSYEGENGLRPVFTTAKWNLNVPKLFGLKPYQMKLHSKSEIVWLTLILPQHGELLISDRTHSMLPFRQ
ncbi:hypothetical protein IE4872_PD00363 (plasmid) [Rhizobium gallicum]|uniref:Uncharacterized protein n=1 Tax=Rhizobium gallicum TaxID=56730 RepID=A0A1L5NSN0_9HYPH|nr:hypothetical protein [Rhizobium gallicum]APO70897.1 hypothetical protein IE4872_PD00363 [Rhizobium gallicum]